MKVLQRKADIVKAREKLVEMAASAIDSPVRKIMRRLRLAPGMPVGDMGKSWDVLETIKFVQEHIARDQPILDMGAYASEVVVALHQLGFENLSGADLDPNVKNMPHSESINYEVCDFMRTPFADGSFSAITSISVIEHGYDGNNLFKEVGRLLKSGGYFIASFDYWQSKIDTDGIKFFDMSWLIFSEQDVAQLIECAAGHGLRLVGTTNFSGDEKPIRCAGKDYTFGWIVLRKDQAT